MQTSNVSNVTTPAAGWAITPVQSKPARSSSSLAQIQSTAASAQAATLAASYSTSVNGANYSGSVEESGGTYTASIPNLPGATASGSSVQAAENNLNIRIDILA